uniref:F-box protein At3g25750 family n=2 Tax=Cajanus cajan TaxID=3821 RepID=A0A151T2A8_CAJCA|nr:Putative F-box protein At3g25750 family [Cajanus cajan]
MQFADAIGFNGKFYALSVQGSLAVIEVVDSSPRVTGLSATRMVPSVSSKHFREYLLESEGEILLVYLISRKSSVHNVDGVEVYRLNFARLSWLKLETLGERAVFVGSNCSMSVMASEVGCRKNCIYFRHPVDDDLWWVYDMESGNISLGWSETNPATSAIWIEQIDE